MYASIVPLCLLLGAQLTRAAIKPECDPGLQVEEEDVGVEGQDGATDATTEPGTVG